jgi:peptide/nickel transport system permease protein
MMATIRTVRLFARHRVAALAGTLLLAAAMAAAVPAWLAPLDPERVDLAGRLRPPGWRGADGAVRILGTDQLGRDIVSRIIHGARVSLMVGVLSVLGAGALGVALGVVAGYYGGRIDELIMRVLDIQQSVPFLALAIAMVAVLGPGLQNMIIVLWVAGWTLYARVVRGETLSIRETDYVLAARALGAPDWRVLVRHVLPNILSPTLVIATFTFSHMIITEATLTFLGLGVQPPTATWGSMLSDGREYIQVAWWLPTFPGMVLVLIVIGANLLGDRMRDLLDPTLRQSL